MTATGEGQLPSIIIAGVQKCGTAALRQILLQHPAVREPVRWDKGMPGSPPKELHFFNADENFRKGAEWYARCFPDEPAHCIEATPEYVTSPKIVRRMADALPETKLIFLMREPVSRALSAWNHWTQERGWATMVPDGDFDSNVRSEVRVLQHELTHRGLVGRGFYIDQIEWLDRYFSPEQVYHGFMEELKGNHHAEIRRIQEFLELPVRDLKPLKVHSRKYEIERPRPDTLKRLRAIYRPFDDRLRKRLDRALPWDDDPVIPG